jgi:hypothetical protein
MQGPTTLARTKHHGRSTRPGPSPKTVFRTVGNTRPDLKKIVGSDHSTWSPISTLPRPEDRTLLGRPTSSNPTNPSFGARPGRSNAASGSPRSTETTEASGELDLTPCGRGVPALVSRLIVSDVSESGQVPPRAPPRGKSGTWHRVCDSSCPKHTSHRLLGFRIRRSGSARLEFLRRPASSRRGGMSPPSTEARKDKGR